MLLAGLGSNKTAIRRGCIETLGTMEEPQAIEPLIEILRYGDHSDFPATIDALNRYNDDRCREEMAKSLQTFSPQLISTFFIFPMLVPSFVGAFKGKEQGQEQFIAHLAAFAQRKDVFRIARHLAIVALGASGNPDALATLGAIAHDPSDELRKLAIVNLANIRAADVVDMLISLIEKHDPAAEDVRDQAVKALRAVVSPKAVPALVNLSDDPRWWIREAALYSLGFIGNTECVPDLLQRLPALRETSGLELAQTLARIGGESAFDGLLTLAHDPRRQTCAEALTYLDLRYPDRAGPALLKLLLEPDYPETVRVLQLLADAPPQGDEFRQVLLKLQQHPNRAVSKVAKRVYQQLDRTLDERLKRIGVLPSGSSISDLWQRFCSWTGVETYRRLLKEAELTSENGIASNSLLSSQKVAQLAVSDPEIGRQVRPLMRFFLAAFFAMFIFMGALPVILFRPLSGLGWLVVSLWPWALGFILVTVVCNLSILANSRRGVLRLLNATMNTVAFICLLGIAVRFVPWLVWAAMKFGHDALVWCARAAWMCWWVTGPLR
jgi:HEAT repeat protein